MSHEQPSGASPTANAASNTTPAPPTLSNGQTSKTPKKAKSQSSTTTNLAPLKPASVLPNMPSLPTGFSASTEEILRRVSANAAAHAGTPGYEAAREQVLKNYVTSASMTSSQPTPKSKRAGKGASKVVGMPSSMRAESATRVVDGSATPASAASTASAKAKGVGRGKGRGAGKGGKRKRAESSESEVRENQKLKCGIRVDRRCYRTTLTFRHHTLHFPPRPNPAATSRNRRNSRQSYQHLRLLQGRSASSPSNQGRQVYAKYVNEVIARHAI